MILSHESILNCLKNGLILMLFYVDKKNIRRYRYLIHGKILNVLYPNLKYDSKKVYDLCLDTPFNFRLYEYDSMMYPVIPENISILDVASNQCDLTKNKKHLKRLKITAKDLKNALEVEYKKHFLNLKTVVDYNDIDLYILRFYPKVPKNKKELIKDLKNDINEKYFVAMDQNDLYSKNLNQEAVSMIPAFSLFGISEKNIEVRDEVFLNALKRKWFGLIQKEKNNMLKTLKKMNVSFLGEKEKEEFKKEFFELKKMLDKISIKDLDDCKTPKDVIRYWPITLQPEPAYVYGN
jgi:hypothetical protein